MKKIALVCTGLNDLGGANNHLKNLYNGLVQAGYKVNIIVCSSLESQVRDFMTRGGVKEGDLTFIPRNRKLLIFPMIISLKILFQKNKYDIIHSFHIQSDIFCGLAARLLGLKNLYSYYESTIFPENISFVKKVFYKVMNEFTKKLFIKTVVVSNGLKKELIIHNFRKSNSVEVIHLGVDVPKEYLGLEFEFCNLKNNTPVIGTIARLSKEKGIDRLIRTIPLVLKEMPKTHFVIIGDGREEKASKALVNEVGVAENVTFKPWTDNVYESLKEIDIFVMPSLREGCPTALIEAMFMKRPIVASDIMGIQDIININNSIIINTQNIEDFSSAILSLCYNPPKAISLGKNAYEEAKNRFSAKVEIDKLIEIYK